MTYQSYLKKLREEKKRMKEVAEAEAFMARVRAARIFAYLEKLKEEERELQALGEEIKRPKKYNLYTIPEMNENNSNNSNNNVNKSPKKNRGHTRKHGGGGSRTRRNNRK